MKIGIVTFVRCNNYGAELQAFATQHVLNKMGHDAEVLDLQKDAAPQKGIVKEAIISRYKYFGLFKGTIRVIQLIKTKYEAKQKKGYDHEKAMLKKKRYDDFFMNYIKHSKKRYHVSDLRNAQDIPWEVIVTGSDQVWNNRQSSYLDVFFLEFAKRLGKHTVAYAPSFGFSEIPNGYKDKYSDLLDNIDSISVRESQGLAIIKSLTDRPACQVLDPTLLLNKDEWLEAIGLDTYMTDKQRYVVIYTITGSTYIYRLAKTIANRLNADVINIKGDYSKVKKNDGIIHILDAGPREFVTLLSRALYVITDSFHGTAFSINFNVPFTTLMNPVSRNNSRSISMLTALGLEERYMYDDGSNKIPNKIDVDFTNASRRLNEMRVESMRFLTDNI